MGYHLTVVKSKEYQFTFEELKRAAEKIEQSEISNVPQKVIFHLRDSNTLNVHFSNGSIFTKDPPTEENIAKLYDLAEALGGRLRGDEMESYRKDGSTYTHPEDASEEIEYEKHIQKLQARKTLWSILRVVAVIVVIVFLVLNAIK